MFYVRFALIPHATVKQTKTVVFNAFKHILATIEANNTNNKQQALLLEKDSISIAEERKSFDEQLDQLIAQHNQKLLDLDAQNKEQLNLKDDDLSKIKSDLKNIEDSKDILVTKLSDTKKELLQVQTIAEQVQTITTANKELRDELSKLTDTSNQKLLDLDTRNEEQLNQLKELEQNNFKDKLLLENKDKEILQLKEQMQELQTKGARIGELEKENIVLSTKLKMMSN